MINPLRQHNSEASTPIQSLYTPLPAFGQAVKLVDGIWWARLPLSGVIDHVNVYLLEDESGWTLIDTGNNSEGCRDGVERLMSSVGMSPTQLTSVCVTHYHPDHCGLAGWICDSYGAKLIATRTCWLNARLLQLDQCTVPRDEHIRFMQNAGIVDLELESYRRRPPTNYWDQVVPPTNTYQRIKQGDILHIGSRRWTVHAGHGHAAEHATLWSDDGIVITGDQVLPGISPNLSVHPSEPDADVVAEWLESCSRIYNLSNDGMLCLPGHNSPFIGLKRRCAQLIQNTSITMSRIFDCLAIPCTVVECLPAVYRRPLHGAERNSLLAEVVGYLNHLQALGAVQSDWIRGSLRWRRAVANVEPFNSESNIANKTV